MPGAGHSSESPCLSMASSRHAVLGGISPEALIVSHTFVGALVALLMFCFLEIMGWTPGATPRKCRCGGKKGKGRGVQPRGKGQRPAKTPPVPTCPLPQPGMASPLTLSPGSSDSVLLEPSQPLRMNWPMHPDVDGWSEAVEQLNRTLKDFERHLESSNCETVEGRDSSLTSTMGLTHESTLEQELDLTVTVKTLQDVPASAPPRPHQPENRGVVVPIVLDPPFLDEAAKRDLEALISKMKIQRRYGLQRWILDCEPCFEFIERKLKDSGTFPPEEHLGCPSRSKADEQSPPLTNSVHQQNGEIQLPPPAPR
ncbi:PREDICTED: uncharacterized protein LOC106896633 [Calidris pugnax]|uniref:uncharacterized protein LOC106896633 n=1 Tax=Calidris pugnax TaxID=198806 RepID=UPI00071C9CD9|nr:PREDICTED: uncharacterized protein LOC106896633 [Calidris pugnax]